MKKARKLAWSGSRTDESNLQRRSWALDKYEHRKGAKTRKSQNQEGPFSGSSLVFESLLEAAKLRSCPKLRALQKDAPCRDYALSKPLSNQSVFSTRRGSRIFQGPDSDCASFGFPVDDSIRTFPSLPPLTCARTPAKDVLKSLQQGKGTLVDPDQPR